jgi:Rrf2 family iron-sulfur cluster assembly transcriptional regulator
MQLTTKGRYAVMAMTDLASREASDGLVNLADIAARQQLSQSYLEQLFAKLRRAGLVSSARGPGGGYRLSRPASAITVSDIVAAVDEAIATTRCTGTTGCMVAPHPGMDPMRCQTHDLWFALNRHIAAFLEATTLADVVHGNVARLAG